MSWLWDFNFQDDFLFIVLAAAVVFLIFFIRMVRNESEQRRDIIEEQAPPNKFAGTSVAVESGIPSASDERFDPAPKNKFLNNEGVPFTPDGRGAYFNFSGHSFNAYEALGLSENATKEEVIQAYESALDSVDQQSREFIELAYLCLQKHMGFED